MWWKRKFIIDSVSIYPESETSGRVQSGHDPEPYGESRVGKVEERQGKQVQQPESRPKGQVIKNAAQEIAYAS